MPFLLAFLSPRLLFWAAILGLVLALGGQTIRLDHAQTAFAREQAERAKVEAERERIAREAEAKIARIQADHAAATQALADAYEQDRARLADDNARLAADAGGLRADIERFASARPAKPDVDPAACRHFADRAVTLGGLFGDADRLAESLAREAERRNAEVRALKQQLLADRTACNPQP